MFWVAVCFALGEAYAVAAGHSVIISGLMILAALVVSVISGRSNAAMLFFRRIFVCGIFGLILIMGYMNVKTMEDSGKTADRIAEKKTCQMIGLVDDIRGNSKGYQVYIQAESIDIYNVDMKVIVYMSDAADMKIGQQFAINGDFARPDKATNPGEFDALSYYAHRGIYLICKGGTVAGKGTGYSPVKQYLYQFRMRAGEVLDKYFDESDSSVMRAMLLGEKSGIDKDTKKLFQINGIAHILAISGVHIAIIGMSLFRLLRKLGRSNIVPGVVAMVMIILYGMMTGLASSTLRAVIMMAIVVAAKIRGRSPDMMTSAGIACVIQAFADPYIVFDAGFQLSFAAVLGIAIVTPLLVKLFPRKRAIGYMQKFRSALLINISVTLTTTPIVIYYYYQFPLYSVALNMVIVPLVSVVLFCCIAVIFLEMIFAGSVIGVAAEWIAIPAKYILKLYRWLCEIACGLPGYSVNVGYITVEMLAVFYVVVILGLWIICKSRGRLHIIMVVMLLLLGCGYECVVYDRGFRVVCMDVGQGDGILIRSGSGTNILIDGGSSDNSQVGEYVIAPVLRYYGAAHIDYAIVTHGDNDHVSGVKYLLETKNTGVVIDNIILPMYGAQDSLEEIKTVAEQAGVNIIYMKRGDMLSVQKGRLLKYDGRDMAKISLSFLYPGPETGINDVNELSAVVRLDHQGYSMLFTGDLGEIGEKQLLEQGIGVEADVLKVGHHGSRYSSSGEFLDAVAPKIAVISAGKDNRYGHPHGETLDRLKDHGADIFCTIECGAVSVTIDRGGLKTEKYR